MDRSELLLCLRELNLAPKEAATLLGYDQRTIKRWQERGAKVPKVAAEALRAWQRLNRRKLPWRPDAHFLSQLEPDEAAEQIHLYQDRVVTLDAILQRVKKRNGPASKWQVDLSMNVAELGDMQVHFYRLQGGGFSPASYSRHPGPVDAKRDELLIEDAIACIADAFQKEAQEKENTEFLSDKEAVARGIYGSGKFLSVDIEAIQDRPGWYAVEGSIFDSGDGEGMAENTPLRPNFGNVFSKRLPEVLRQRAIKQGVRYIVVPQWALPLMQEV